MPAQIMISKILTKNALFQHALIPRNFHSLVFAARHAQNSTRMLMLTANVLFSPTTPVAQTLHTKKATRNAWKHAQNICSLKVLRRDAKLLLVKLVKYFYQQEHVPRLAQTIQRNQLMVRDVRQTSVKVLLSSLEKMVLVLLPAQITKRQPPMERNVKLQQHASKSLLLMDHVLLPAQTSTRILLMLMWNVLRLLTYAPAIQQMEKLTWRRMAQHVSNYAMIIKKLRITNAMT